ncbi:MAG TPA: type 1 glutamine amidotransferase [Acidimicrobiia bacterium]|nr:type 1 glutamine amidotransferase [Acidimicrobiia bacterium]
MRPVVVVQNMSDSSLGWLSEAFRAAGVEMTRVRANEGAALPSVDEAAAIVVLGGTQGAYEADRYPYLNAEMRLIQKAASADVPTLGICLGAQLMAAALGGRAFPAEAVEVGWPDVVLTDAGSRDPLICEVTGPVLVWHHDTFELPPDAELLASTRYPLAFRAGRAVGVQFHPECSPQMLAEWVDRTPQGTFDADGIDPESWLRQARDLSHRARAVSMRFFAAWLNEVADAAN